MVVPVGSDTLVKLLLAKALEPTELSDAGNVIEAMLLSRKTFAVIDVSVSGSATSVRSLPRNELSPNDTLRGMLIAVRLLY